MPLSRWNVEEYYDAERGVPGKMYVRSAHFIAGVEMFDAAFFGMSALEASATDPQQRLWLEVGFEALHNAGSTKVSLMGSETAVYVGVTTADWAHVRGRADAGPYQAIGASNSMIAGR